MRLKRRGHARICSYALTGHVRTYTQPSLAHKHTQFVQVNTLSWKNDTFPPEGSTYFRLFHTHARAHSHTYIVTIKPAPRDMTIGRKKFTLSKTPCKDDENKNEATNLNWKEATFFVTFDVLKLNFLIKSFIVIIAKGLKINRILPTWSIFLQAIITSTSAIKLLVTSF